MEEFDFSCLGAKKEYSVPLNSRILLKELMDRGRLHCNMGARMLYHGVDLTTANYRRVSDFDTEMLWVLNMLCR